MERLKDPKVQGALRHLLTAIGPILVVHGVTDGATWEMYVGAGFAGLGFYGSWTAKEKQ
jgi:hypothetical protein